MTTPLDVLINGGLCLFVVGSLVLSMLRFWWTNYQNSVETTRAVRASHSQDELDMWPGSATVADMHRDAWTGLAHGVAFVVVCLLFAIAFAVVWFSIFPPEL